MPIRVIAVGIAVLAVFSVVSLVYQMLHKPTEVSNSREMITMAERRFPARIKIGVPPGGFGQRYMEMTAWLDANCGADGWAMTRSGVRGVLNDAVSIYFLDATLASAFVARWCAGSRDETDPGYRMSRRRLPDPWSVGIFRRP